MRKIAVTLAPLLILAIALTAIGCGGGESPTPSPEPSPSATAEPTPEPTVAPTPTPSPTDESASDRRSPYTQTGSSTAVSILVFWFATPAVFFGLLGMSLGALNIYYLKTIIRDRDRIKLLEGLLPICSYCKKIRNDEGEWVGNDDYFGFGVSWGAPVEMPSKNQWAIELFYGFQLTERLNVAPDVQFTFNPSFNDEKSYVGVYSVFRARYAL